MAWMSTVHGNKSNGYVWGNNSTLGYLSMKNWTCACNSSLNPAKSSRVIAPSRIRSTIPYPENHILRRRPERNHRITYGSPGSAFPGWQYGQLWGNDDSGLAGLSLQERWHGISLLDLFSGSHLCSGIHSKQNWWFEIIKMAESAEPVK